MSQSNQNPYANGIMNEQQFNQSAQALNSYCKVMRVPKLGVAPVVITILEGLITTLLMAVAGMGILKTVIVGGFITAMFGVMCWILYRYRVGAAERFNAYLNEDGGQGMIIDFASAQPFADDQFRLGRHYLFKKGGAVIKRDCITDIVRTNTHASMVPTGVYLTVVCKDDSGSLTFPLCRVHMLNSWAEVDEIRNAVLQRRMSI